MTSLFLNEDGNSAMDNRQQLNSGLSKANKTDILGKIKLVFFQHFEQVVDDCCSRIDLEVGVHLGKNRGKISKEQYIKLLEYLHSVRKELKKNYLLKVSESFELGYQITANSPAGKLDFSNLSLSSDDTVQENQAVTQIISQCQNLFYEELASLNKYITVSPGKQTVARSQNPIFPEKLILTLVEVIKPLQLTSDSRIALYKVFEANVFMQLGFVYHELIKLCNTTDFALLKSASEDASFIANVESRRYAQSYLVGEINEEVESTQASVEQPDEEFKLLQQKLEQWRMANAPSAYDLMPVTLNIFYEHFEIKNALQILQQFNEDSESGEKKLPLKWRVVKKLKELGFRDKVNNLTQQDEDLLDLVALIFDEIERDEILDSGLKTYFLKLEIPMAAASLGRYSVITHQDNPVRQLLDNLFSAGLFLTQTEYDDQLIQQRIESSVTKITKESGFDFSVWCTEASDFLSYINKQNQRSQHIEASVRELLNHRQALGAIRKDISDVIENSLKGKALPQTIVNFLRNVWSEVLLAVYQCKDEQPEQWVKSIQAMDELIISVMPPVDEQARKQLLKLLPGLITELRKGLKLISYDKPTQARFFKDLAVWHIILMDKKEPRKTLSDVSEDKLVAENEKIQSIADSSSVQAQNLPEQSWVAFTSESARQWGKLIWKDDLMDSMVFVGKNGEKIVEIQTVELAEKLRLGQAAIVKMDQKTITERVLSKLTGL